MRGNARVRVHVSATIDAYAPKDALLQSSG